MKNLKSQTAYRLFNKRSNTYTNRLFGTPEAAYKFAATKNWLYTSAFKKTANKAWFFKHHRIDKIEIIEKIVERDVRTKGYRKKKLIAKLKRLIAKEQKTIQ